MLHSRVRDTLHQRGLLAGVSKVLVACSGGPDSTALLDVLHGLRAEHGCELFAASVNHGLRARADLDVACAGRMAARLGVPFFPLSVVVAPGSSVQAQARSARYEALLACARELGATRVAVGHTQDDQAETVLARLMRGCGISGLSGIAPLREDGVVRPLIDCSRASVHAHVATRQLEVALDPSNHDERYERVRIRKQLLPTLCAANPQIVRDLCAIADEARVAQQAIDAECDRILDVGTLNVARLRAVTRPMRGWVLRTWCEREHGIALLRTHIEALERMLQVGGEVRLPGDWVASIERKACDVESNFVLRRIQKRGRGSERRT